MPKFYVTVKVIVKADTPIKAKQIISKVLDNAGVDPYHIPESYEVDKPDNWVAFNE